MQIGRRVAKLREAHGESLRDAAYRTGVSHTTIARIEKDDVIGSFQSTLRKIADGYGVRVEYLLGSRDPRQEFLGAIGRLNQYERARLCFLSMRSRLRMTVDFLTSEFPDEFSVEQLTQVLGTSPTALEAMLEKETEEPAPQDSRMAETLSRLTGIPFPWFTSGAISSEPGEAIASEQASQLARLMKKAALAGLAPTELEMAIDLLITRAL